MKIGIPGAAGRMGQALTRQVTATDGCTVVAATEVPEHPALGRDCGALAGIEPLGVAVGDDAQAMFRAADAVLDFTLPGAAARHAVLECGGRRHDTGGRHHRASAPTSRPRWKRLQRRRLRWFRRPT